MGGGQLPRRQPGAAGQGFPARDAGRHGNGRVSGPARGGGPGQYGPPAAEFDGYGRPAAVGGQAPGGYPAPEGHPHPVPDGYGYPAADRYGYPASDGYGNQNGYEQRPGFPYQSGYPGDQAGWQAGQQAGGWSGPAGPQRRGGWPDEPAPFAGRDGRTQETWQAPHGPGQQFGPAEPYWENQPLEGWNGPASQGGYRPRPHEMGRPWPAEAFRPGPEPPPGEGIGGGYPDDRARWYDRSGGSPHGTDRYQDAGYAPDPRGGGRPADSGEARPVPARRTGQPAALPAGPSARIARTPESADQSSDGALTARPGHPAQESTRRDERDHGVPRRPDGESARPGESEPAASGVQAPAEPARPAMPAVQQEGAAAAAGAAAAPPSPTGMIPPAVTEVADPSPPDSSTRADAPGYDAVSAEAETTPMAVILGDGPPPAAASQAAPAPDQAARVSSESPGPRIRGPFEAYDGPALADPGSPSPSETLGEPAAHEEPGAEQAAAKMDQIKDLYLTAEAIGEDALDKHFELVSDRQRQLIREYFDRAVTGGADSRDTAS